MSCFRAARGAEAMTACELIRGADGEHWPDVSAWYWSALLGAQPGALVVVRGGRAGLNGDATSAPVCAVYPCTPRYPCAMYARMAVASISISAT